MHSPPRWRSRFQARGTHLARNGVEWFALRHHALRAAHDMGSHQIAFVLMKSMDRPSFERRVSAHSAMPGAKERLPAVYDPEPIDSADHNRFAATRDHNTASRGAEWSTLPLVRCGQSNFPARRRHRRQKANLPISRRVRGSKTEILATQQ